MQQSISVLKNITVMTMCDPLTVESVHMLNMICRMCLFWIQFVLNIGLIIILKNHVFLNIIYI
jgi:hypothetical protein